VSYLRKSERRKTERWPIFVEGTISFAGRFRLKCLVQNLSATGAKLAFRMATDAPSEFYLNVLLSGKETRCLGRTRWRRHHLVGVEFVEAECVLPQSRISSLIPGLGVKLSTIILAGPTVLSAVGACPPHDGVRRRWRINVEIAVALLDARKKSDDLTTATVPAGTTFPAVSREPCDLLCVLRGSLLRRPVELGSVDPHAVQNDRELPRDGDLGLAEAVSLGELGSPSL